MDSAQISTNLQSKQTYKHLRPVIQSLSNSQSQSLRSSIDAIKAILESKTVSPEIKLYSVRFLKDCFAKDNPGFNKAVEVEILPLLRQIALDSADKSALKKYVSDGSQANFTYLNSLYRITLQCLHNWCRKEQSDSDSAFVKTRKELVYKGVEFPKDSHYFKPSEYRQLVALQDTNRINRSFQSSSSKQSTKSNHPSKITMILHKLKILPSQNLSYSETKEQVERLSKEFDRVLDEYVSLTQNFDQKYFDDCYSKLQAVIHQVKLKSKPVDPVELDAKAQTNSRNKTEKNFSFRKESIQSSQTQKAVVEQLKNIPEKFMFVESDLSDDQVSNEIGHKKQIFNSDLSTIKEQALGMETKFSVSNAAVQSPGSPQLKLLNQLNTLNMYRHVDEDHFSVVNQINKGIYQRAMDKQYFKGLPKKLGETKKSHRQQDDHNRSEAGLSTNVQVKPHVSRVQARKASQQLTGNGILPNRQLPRQQTISRVVQNYNSFTCAQNRLLSQHNKSSVKLFKLSVLNSSLAFFQNTLIYLEREIRNTEVKHKQILNFKLLFHTGKVLNIQTKYQNVRQIDLWVKPVDRIEEKQYQQEIAIQLLNVPLNLIQLSVVLDGAIVQCLLPILFISFLRPGEVNPKKFDQIFKSQQGRIVKSPVFVLNHQMIGQASDFQKYYPDCYHSSSTKSIQLSFLYPQKELVLLTRITLHPNQRAQFWTLQLSDNHRKYSRELNDNMIFLFTL